MSTHKYLIDHRSVTIDILKRLLDERGLRKTGKKAELVHRLKTSIKCEKCNNINYTIKCKACSKQTCEQCSSPCLNHFCSGVLCKSCKTASKIKCYAPNCQASECCGVFANCDKCKKLACSTHTKPCMKCQKNFCSGCNVTSCPKMYCNKGLCPNCQSEKCQIKGCTAMECCDKIRDCTQCQKKFCSSHSFECKGCSKVKCSACSTIKRCGGCYSPYCTSCNIKSCDRCTRSTCCALDLVECSKCKKTTCKKSCSTECAKCKTLICVGCSKSCAGCSKRFCHTCDSKKCTNCSRLECCGEIKQCPLCKNQTCKHCFTDCFKCKTSTCKNCVLRCYYLNSPHSCDHTACKTCYEIVKCADPNCRQFQCSMDSTPYKSCSHCSKKFCSRSLESCSVCLQIFCKQGNLETVKGRKFCQSCLRTSGDLDLKYQALLNILMDKDFRNVKVESFIFNLPLLKRNGITIIYPTHFMNSQDIKAVKMSKEDLQVSKTFHNVFDTTLKEKVKDNLYPEVTSTRIAFEKIFILEKDELLTKQVGKQLNDKHIANILLILPSSFKGGEISININETQIEKLDFSIKDDLQCNYVVFPSNYDYQVSKIESGNCFILLYNVFNEGLTKVTPPKSSLLYDAKKIIDELFQKPEIKKSGKIAFALQSSYPKLEKGELRGKDLQIYSLLDTLEDYKIKINDIEVKSTFTRSYSYYDSSDDEEDEDEERCNCMSCRMSRYQGEEAPHSNKYTIETKNLPIINRDSVNLSTILQGRPSEVQRYVDGVRETIYKHGVLEITKRKRKRTSKEEDDNDEDEEIAIVEQPKEKSVKCPISKCTMDEPVKSKVCGHSFDKSSILTYLDGQVKVCPLSGCNKQISINSLENDLELIEMLKNYVSEEEEEEEETPKKIVKVEAKKENVVTSNPLNTPSNTPVRRRIITQPEAEVIVIDD